MTVQGSSLTYEGLAAHDRPKLSTEIPGPEALAVVERDRRVTSPSLPRAYPFAPRRGAGSIVEDVDGNIFLDLNAGIAVTSTGHCHPRVVDAVQYRTRAEDFDFDITVQRMVFPITPGDVLRTYFSSQAAATKRALIARPQARGGCGG